MNRLGARVVLGLLWLLHLLPLGLLSLLGRGLGRLLYRFGRARREVARRNIERCLPDWSPERQQALLHEHFEFLGRSLLERGVLWWASPERLRRLIHVEGDVTLAECTEGRFMWVVPHFLGLEVAGVASQLFQKRLVTAFYQRQSNPVFDEAIRRGRLRFDQGTVHTRHDNALKLLRDVRQGAAFLNLPDMDFGLKDADFIDFFGIPAATLLAPARMARSLKMTVQPVVAEMLPGGQGWRVRFLPPWTDFPGDQDDRTATRRLNAWIEAEIQACPAQYLWVHKRFKTRPAGEPSFYA
jgi:KDO2-lipid IV(A) lauroyltransferase